MFRLHGQVSRLEHLMSVHLPAWMREELEAMPCPYIDTRSGAGSILNHLPRNGNTYDEFGFHSPRECQSSYCLAVERIDCVVREMRIHICGQHYPFNLATYDDDIHAQSLAYLQRGRDMLDRLFSPQSKFLYSII